MASVTFYDRDKTPEGNIIRRILADLVIGAILTELSLSIAFGSEIFPYSSTLLRGCATLVGVVIGVFLFYRGVTSYREIKKKHFKAK